MKIHRYRETPMKYAPLYALITLGVTISLLTGCTVGPDFTSPAKPDVTDYTTTPLPSKTAGAPTPLGEAQYFTKSKGINSRWWQELGSARLNTLVLNALEASPTLRQAQATLNQAEELYMARAGSSLYPQVAANLGTQRQRFSPSTSGLTGDAREFALYNTGVGINYTLDLTGGNRRALEALAARIDYQRYQLAGARLNLVARIVTTAITQASIYGQIQATKDILHAQEEQLELTKERVRLGQAAADEVSALQTPVEQTRATIPLLSTQLQHTEHLLAVLAGRPPGAGDLPAFTLTEFTLPTNLPLIIPSELVHSRPDIQAAEALLHTANAEYGMAIARLYPQINLSADLGLLSLTTESLFSGSSTVWGLVGQLTQPLLNPGLPAEKRAALAGFDAAAANYQNIVLEALRNVADVLRALENNAQRLGALVAADLAAQKSFHTMQRRYELGAASYVQLLIAQQQVQQTRLNLIEGQARRLTDSAALYQAMGGDI
ncbi:efflux transporter outer membrane subunit [Desulforhopalus sp. IMCC35007]|uniref:efflux transporter outer membrane subunit n=1 Tax=Desulforhopalus sp. IMCC35007 TaxID=2569543 RepID=UPI00197A72C1|nr:efflux transporter outer membrane subunit [Desulforhopalus sp. IMCC35007]